MVASKTFVFTNTSDDTRTSTKTTATKGAGTKHLLDSPPEPNPKRQKLTIENDCDGIYEAADVQKRFKFTCHYCSKKMKGTIDFEKHVRSKQHKYMVSLQERWRLALEQEEKPPLRTDVRIYS
eukprot:TRINITY_DN2342_c0_g2_i3.p1 TRINITY_DN2342_c0_g2~~TRINITY_DN2342_c0_g2_i3.p1  ORF type:complete len:123 (-),score=28.67 TRINITY_DN2342_c0_g2_i3:100-468(-)